MPPRTRGLTESDRAAWAAYSRMIVPLPGRPEPAAGPPSSGPPASGLPTAEPAPPRSAAGDSHPHPAPRLPRQLAASLEVGNQPGGLDKATWQRLRGGRLATERTLDLHGMTVQHAYQSLVGFLRGAHAQRLRCVEVITGRGSGENSGAIRRELPHWLNRPDIRPLVLGAAHPHAQNPGSVRLLLRRVR